MRNVSEYALYLIEQLEPIGAITLKRLFGGVCFAHDGMAFAIMPNEALYFVADEQTRPHYEACGMQCFAYDTKKGRVQVRRYYAVPDEILADSDLLQEWAKRAIQAARNTPTKMSKRKVNKEKCS